MNKLLDLGSIGRVTGVTSDSRKVQPGNVFIALSGQKYDGRNFILDAAARGASAVIAELDTECTTIAHELEAKFNIPLINIPNLAKELPRILQTIYPAVSTFKNIIAVTGTNGKTSTTHFIAQLLRLLGKKCGIIGTLGIGYYSELNTSSLTTPDLCTNYQTIANFIADGAEYVVMEASSHALDQGRLDGLKIKAAVFTNLTLDHLDYHGTVENYWAAKKRLFVDYQPEYSIVNIDDARGLELLALQDKTNLTAVSLQTEQKYSEKFTLPIIKIKAVTYGITKTLALIDTPYGTCKLETALLGDFNLRNIMFALAVLLACGYNLSELEPLIPLLEPPSGRMQKFERTNAPTVVVDYAHTPDALELVLKFLRAHAAGKLWCVFGCGGERDRSKRPIMLKTALIYSDVVIITQDNPRNEPYEQILADMLQGKQYNNVILEKDRIKAINLAIKQAHQGDLVLVAGKGHENYQLVSGQKIDMSDLVTVKNAIEEVIVDA